MKKKLNIFFVGLRFQSPPFDLLSEIKAGTSSLKRDPNNEKDKNAVKVFLKGYMVGYVDRESAIRVSAVLNSGVSYELKFRKQHKNSIEMDFCFEFNNKINSYPDFPLGEQIGIYKISIKNDTEVYIGQSNEINARLRYHWNELHSFSHPNINLQESWINCSGEGIKANIIDVLPNNIPSQIKVQKWLEERERYWIGHYKGRAKCLNLTDGELILTKKAEEEFKKGEKKYDSNIRAERKSIKEKIDFENKLFEEKNEVAKKLNFSMDELRSFISKNTGLIGIFRGNSAATPEIERRKAELTDLNARYATALKEKNCINEKIKLLKEELKSLKTVKQIADAQAVRQGKYKYLVSDEGKIKTAIDVLPDSVISSVIELSLSQSENHKSVKKYNKVSTEKPIVGDKKLNSLVDVKSTNSIANTVISNGIATKGRQADTQPKSAMVNLPKKTTIRIICPTCNKSFEKVLVAGSGGFLASCVYCGQQLKNKVTG